MAHTEFSEDVLKRHCFIYRHHGRDRKIFAVGNKYAMYQSSGNNSGNPGTAFPMFGVSKDKNGLLFSEPGDVGVSAGNTAQFPDEIATIVANKALLLRFGNFEAMVISMEIGGGYWDPPNEKGPSVKKFIEENYPEYVQAVRSKNKLDETLQTIENEGEPPIIELNDQSDQAKHIDNFDTWFQQRHLLKTCPNMDDIRKEYSGLLEKPVPKDAVKAFQQAEVARDFQQHIGLSPKDNAQKAAGLSELMRGHGTPSVEKSGPDTMVSVNRSPGVQASPTNNTKQTPKHRVDGYYQKINDIDDGYLKAALAKLEPLLEDLPEDHILYTSIERLLSGLKDLDDLSQSGAHEVDENTLQDKKIQCIESFRHSVQAVGEGIESDIKNQERMLAANKHNLNYLQFRRGDSGVAFKIGVIVLNFTMKAINFFLAKGWSNDYPTTSGSLDEKIDDLKQDIKKVESSLSKSQESLERTSKFKSALSKVKYFDPHTDNDSENDAGPSPEPK